MNLVVNYNMPTKYETGEPDYEVYLHRVGRAGRFGRKGELPFFSVTIKLDIDDNQLINCVFVWQGLCSTSSSRMGTIKR